MKVIQQELTTPLSQNATLTSYVIDNSAEIDETKVRPAVVICPGGGYVNVSEREAEPVALQMVARGFQAFIVRYNVAPHYFPTALLELAEAVKTIRQNANEWHVDPNQIIVAGFSAGGHLAASLGDFWSGELLKTYGYQADEIKPNGLLLAYSVITSGKFAHRGSFVNLLGDDFKDKAKREAQSLELQVNDQTPKTFLWTTYTDGAVPMENTMLFAEALRAHNINFELHIFPAGGHGLSLGNIETQHRGAKSTIQPEIQLWPDLFATWVHNQIEK